MLRILTPPYSSFSSHHTRSMEVGRARWENENIHPILHDFLPSSRGIKILHCSCETQLLLWIVEIFSHNQIKKHVPFFPILFPPLSFLSKSPNQTQCKGFHFSYHTMLTGIGNDFVIFAAKEPECQTEHFLFPLLHNQEFVLEFYTLSLLGVVSLLLCPSRNIHT